jgi:hypothetical protein
MLLRKVSLMLRNLMQNITDEPKYSIHEVAQKLNTCDNTARKLFVDEPGVIKISMPTLATSERKRAPRVLLKVPESVFERVAARLTASPVDLIMRGRRTYAGR